MNRLLTCLCILSMFSCEKSSTENGSPDAIGAILGSWQQVSYQYSIGGPLLSEDVKNGEIVRFNADLTFSISNIESDFDITGTYRFQNDTLTRIYDADSEKINYILKTEIVQEELTLIPVGPQICIEGCSFKYRKIN